MTQFSRYIINKGKLYEQEFACNKEADRWIVIEKISRYPHLKIHDDSPENVLHYVSNGEIGTLFLESGETVNYPISPYRIPATTNAVIVFEGSIQETRSIAERMYSEFLLEREIAFTKRFFLYQEETDSSKKAFC